MFHCQSQQHPTKTQQKKLSQLVTLKHWVRKRFRMFNNARSKAVTKRNMSQRQEGEPERIFTFIAETTWSSVRNDRNNLKWDTRPLNPEEGI